MVQPTRTAIHIHGIQNQSAVGVCGDPWYVFGQPSMVNGYVVRNGDSLSFDHKALAALSGVWLGFGPGTFSNGTYSSDLTDNAPDGNWHHTQSDLSSFVGQTVTALVIGPGSPYTPVGPYDVWVENITVQSADGSVHPLFTGGTASGTSWGNCGNTTVTLNVEPTATENVTAAHYFLADALGTTQLEFSASGATVWRGEFAPFGQELDTQLTNNHYKFTGKERDNESGLDYFGARYYSSYLGSFMSPDWAAQVEAVPYAKLTDPQSLNLYAYVRNNPLNSVDVDGHADAPIAANKLDDNLAYSCGVLCMQFHAAANFFLQGASGPPQAQQNGAGQNKGDVKKGPPNSTKDVVLASDEIPVKALRVNPFLYTTTWYAYEFKNGVLGKRLPNATISLSESMNGGPFQPTGDPSKGIANDQLMAGPPVNQRWSVNGLRVQLVMSKGADGNLSLTWEAHIVRSGARPVYSSVP